MSYMSPEKPFQRAHVTATPQRTGLDDGPKLPSQAVRDRAAAKIEAMYRPTDAERINWLESMKYGRFGIGYDGHRYQVRIDLAGREYFGRTFREAVDNGIKGEKMNVGNPMSESECDRMKAHKDRLIEDEKQKYFEEGYDQCFREVIGEIKTWNHSDTKSFIMWLSKTFKSSASKL